MAAFVALFLLVAVAVVGFAIRHWLSGRLSPLKDHSKKQEELNTDGVEIVIQKPVPERRLKLALPDLSSIQIGSPVGPMKSSIRSALKELRSRQMVQSLCSRFESRTKVPSEAEHDTKDTTKKSVAGATQQTKTRRRDARDAAVAPVLLASDLAKEAEITANARSNNLNKFLRSYASNLDNAISAERRVTTTNKVVSVERSVVIRDAEDDVKQPLLVQTGKSAKAEKTTPSSSESDESIMDLDRNSFGGERRRLTRLVPLELDLRTLKVKTEYSNQCDSPPTAGSEEEVPGLVDATDCEPFVDEEPEVGNNNANRGIAARLSIAFTLLDFPDVTKKMALESDNRPESCSDPPAKEALARFKQQVPSNRRRAHTIAPLKI
ncbi:hypothetical protein AM587_10008220 [Phytophthora nicotianae]|uniref:Uncharacterized protein n=1 Tax=Phytophthora nicotianae TaxID=4792 RepID=A0A0W8DUN9_PHYNI|nr:hypothetical protein AM587_10008220 [Phytophthora nicotianae]